MSILLFFGGGQLDKFSRQCIEHPGDSRTGSRKLWVFYDDICYGTAVLSNEHRHLKLTPHADSKSRRS